MCADLNVDITEADIAEARREMWGNFPRDIEFQSFTSGSRMKIHLLEWEINPSLREGTFRLDVPKGVEIIEMK